jgi:hypothetical protein
VSKKVNKFAGIFGKKTNLHLHWFREQLPAMQWSIVDSDSEIVCGIYSKIHPFCAHSLELMALFFQVLEHL